MARVVGRSTRNEKEGRQEEEEDDDDYDDDDDGDVSHSDEGSDDDSSGAEENTADVEEGEASSEEEGAVGDEDEDENRSAPEISPNSSLPHQGARRKADPEEKTLSSKQTTETTVDNGEKSYTKGENSIQPQGKEEEGEKRQSSNKSSTRNGSKTASGKSEREHLEDKSKGKRLEEKDDRSSSRKSSSKKRKDREKDESREKDRKRRRSEKRSSRSRSKDRKGEPSSYEKQLMAYYRRREEPESSRGKTEQTSERRHSRDDRFKDVDREKDNERGRRDRQKEQEKRSRDRDREDREKEKDRARARDRERERDGRRKREREDDRRRVRDRNEDRSRGRDRHREDSPTTKRKEKNTDSMEEVVLDEETQEKILAEIEMGMSKDELEEQRLIEERRKRRLEILEKHKQTHSSDQANDQPANGETENVKGAQAAESFNLSKTSSEIFEIEDHHGHQLDDREDRLERIQTLRKETTNNETKQDHDNKDDADDDDIDDMFADDPEVEEDATKAVTAKAPVQALLDNWDDPEGYYNFRVGEVLAERFEVYASWGKGVFSTVLRARDRNSVDTDVAIKIIRANDTMYKAGQLEMKVLRRLAERDPDGRRHCIRMLEDFEYRGHLCMVFEAMDMNLREVLKKYGRNIGLNITAVRAYAAQLLIALKHTKQCGILHADIKPDNILVDKSNRHLKLADFGSAMLVGENERTPYLVSRFYRAPEVILGLAYDFAMDTWSIATALFELFTGKILFPGNSNNQMLKIMQEVKGPFPRRMLKRGIFVEKHFDSEGRFMSIEADPVTGQDLKRHLSISKPIRELSKLLKVSKSNDEASKLNRNFCDMLDRMLVLDPEKRLTVEEALAHPFIKG